MKKVLIYSLLLLAGLGVSQLLPALGAGPGLLTAIRIMTMFCLAYLMVHVGLEFDIDKSNIRHYGWDYIVAAVAAGLPWILTALYFIFVMTPSDLFGSWDAWKQSLLVSRFSAPTSAGVLFTMLAAAGLSATWVYRKARILAIFDDLDTILLMIPLKIMMVGIKWQLGIIVLVIFGLLMVAWKYLHRLRVPTGGGAILLYAGLVTVVCEAIYAGSKILDDSVPIHLEVLLPAFVLGCVLARGHHEPSEAENRVTTAVTAAFLVLVGLSMPPLTASAETVGSVAGPVLVGGAWPGWPLILLHVLGITVISNLGKMFSVFCYRREASFRERLAVSVAMFPRGEVGAGVLVVSLSYGIGGPAVTVALLSLALNLVLTGVFILIVKRLLSPASPQTAPTH